jgi:hypothetical protein
MRLVLHPAVPKEVARILQNYDQVSSKWDDEFWEELLSTMERAATQSGVHHFERTGRRRRANLKRFPYHFLFREVSGGIRVTAVRHNKTHPQTGLRRI